MIKDLDILHGDLIEERDELAARADKLYRFLDSDEFDVVPPDHQAWLYVQSKAMQIYGEALEARIDLVRSQIAREEK